MHLKDLDIKKVKPIRTKSDFDPKDFLGSEIVYPYSTMYICAKRNSGKTTTLAHIIKEICNKRTKVIAFVPTFDHDAKWIAIKERLDKKNIENDFYDDFDSFDLVMNEITTYKDPEEEEENEEVEEELPQVDYETNIYEDGSIQVKKKKPPKPRKPKKISTRFCLILDDASDFLRDKRLVSLMKKSRHYKCTIILSSQYLNDISPAQHKNVVIHLLFPGLSEEKLSEVYRNCDMSISFNQLKDMYLTASEGQYSFFYMNCRDDDYRKRFNQKFML